MKRFIGAAIAAAVVAFAVPATVNKAAAAPQAKAKPVVTKSATDISARRHYRRHYHYHYGYRPYYGPAYQPYYYARPTYYRPYPYVLPAPFPFGIGFGPFW